MRLDLRSVIHTPDAKKDFQLEIDLSHLDFFGQTPITHPVQSSGCVTNHAGALMLTGTAHSVLELTCDRCGKPFFREKIVPLDALVAQELEDDENDEILLLDGYELDMDEVVTTAFILAMDTKNLCSDDCKGLCSGCGVDLNVDTCRCKPEVDPRLAALAQLLDKETE